MLNEEARQTQLADRHKAMTTRDLRGTYLRRKYDTENPWLTPNIHVTAPMWVTAMLCHVRFRLMANGGTDYEFVLSTKTLAQALVQIAEKAPLEWGTIRDYIAERKPDMLIVPVTKP